MRTVSIILAGGASSRLGKPKPFVEILGKPMLRYVYDATVDLVDEVIVVASRSVDAGKLRWAAPEARMVVEDYKPAGPLRAALEGWRAAGDGSSLLLSCDIPLVSPGLLSMLLEALEAGFDAVVPRWPNGFIEPLCAAYRVEPAVEAASKTWEAGQRRFTDMLSRVKRKLYFSTLAVRDALGSTEFFLNVNSLGDLRRAEHILGRRHR